MAWPLTFRVAHFSRSARKVGAPGAEFSASGNATNDGFNTLVYDAENHAVSISNTGASATYTYDANGLRVKKAVTSGTTTVYIFSGSKVIAEYDNGAAVGSPSREYIYSGGALLAKIESGATQYYHQDGLSARLMTDSSGNVLGSQGHYPFGDPWYPSSPITKWFFTTYERDAESGPSANEGNDFAVARFYRNTLGRFNSPDPLSGSIGDPQSLNRYSYTENDPIDGTDPSGACYAAGWGWVFAAHDVKTLCAPTIERQFLGDVVFEDMDAIIGANEEGWIYNLAIVGEFSVYGPPVGVPDNIAQQFYMNKRLAKLLNKCIKSIFKNVPIPTQTLANAPAVDISAQTMDQMGGQATNAPWEGPYGTINIASDTFEPYGSPQATSSLGAGIFVHELGNILSARYTGSEFTFGNPNGIGKGNKDFDTGAVLQNCVIPGTINY